MSQSSVTFEVWKEEFNKHYVSNFDKKGIYSFMEDMEGYGKQKNPMKAEEKENMDEISHDSYGLEGSKLKRVYYFPLYDIYILFSGTRESYSGTEWNEMKEVKPVVKTYNTYE